MHSTLHRTRKADGDPCQAAGEKGREPKAEFTAAKLGSAALYRLMTWLSPTYPTGAFSYSAGIEWAVEAGDICDAATLRAWLAVMIGEGFAFSDAVFFTHAYRAAAERDDNRLRAIAELAVAFAPSKERHLETTAQGLAFLDMTRASWPASVLDRLSELAAGAVALPVAAGVACAAHGVPLAPGAYCYVHALAANLVSAGVRLIPIGQRDGLRVLAELEPFVTATVERALVTTLHHVGGAAMRADLAAMHHETQHTRLFRS